VELGKSAAIGFVAAHLKPCVTEREGEWQPYISEANDANYPVVVVLNGRDVGSLPRTADAEAFRQV
jgi:hypothetical protein